MNSKKIIKIWTRVLIGECFGKSAAEQKKIFLRLKGILKAKKREYLMPKIAAGALAEMKKQARFELVLAREHSGETVAKLEKKLAAGLEIDDDADVKIRPELIGGFVAKTDQYLIDASVKGQLEQLKNIPILD